MDIDIFQLTGIVRRRLHYVVLAVVACMALAALYTSSLVPLYRASTEILLDPQGLLADRRDLFISGNSPQEQSSLESQTYIVQSRDVVNAVITELALESDPYFARVAKVPPGATPEIRQAALIAAFMKHMRVERAGQSFVLTITAEHPDPVRAALIANTTAQTYLETVANSRSDANRRASESFQAQAGELRERVLKAELAVESFKAEHGLVTAGERGLLIDQQVSGINDQLTQARIAEEQAKTRYDQARNLTVAAIEAGAIPEVAQSQSIELLRSRYTQLLERQAELAAGLGANHPQMRALRSQLAGARQSLDAEIGRLRESLRASYERAATSTRALTAQLEKVTQSSYDSSAALTRMRQLESEAETVRTLYKTFLTRAEELGQTQGVNTNNSRVISQAAPPAAAPGGLKKIVLIAAALFGVALGSGLAVLHEIFVLTRRRSASKPAAQAEHAASMAQAGPAQPALPVIASLPAEPAPPGNLAILAERLRLDGGKRRRTFSDYRRRREIGLLRSVHFLLNAFGERRPVTILFVSPGARPLRSNLVADIADTIADLNQNVAFAPGALAAPQRPAWRAAPRRPLRGMLAQRPEEDEDESEFLLGDRLLYHRLPEEDTPHNRLFSPLADFVLIDACGTQAMDFLPALVMGADAIIVISEQADEEDMQALMLQFEAARRKMAGRIVIGGEA